MKDWIELLEKVKSYWDKKTGLYLLSVIIIYCYFQWLFPLLQSKFPKLSFWNYFVVIVPILIAYLLWAFSTGRLYITTKKFTLGIIIKVDEPQNESQLKRIIKSCVEEILNDFSDVKIILYPINYKKTEKEMERHLKYRLLPIDAFIVATIESGNVTFDNGSSSNKLQLSKFFFTGNFDMNENIQLFKSNLIASKDLSLRLFHKNWSYIESNSFKDKKKIKHNFKDTILYFTAIFLIYKQELELALKILKSLYQPELNKIKHDNDKIYLTKEQVAAFRLNHILLNLYFTTALSDYYQSKCPKKAYQLLLECNDTFPIHPDIYHHLIPMANFAYQCNDLENAIKFTDQAEELKGETIDILLNRGFFALLNNDVDNFRINYSKIARYIIPSNYNMVEVICFFEDQRDKLVDKIPLIDFAEAALTKLFVDLEDGDRLLDEFSGKYSENEHFRRLIELCEDIKQNTTLKTTSISSIRTKVRTSRRKKRRRK